MVLTEDELLRAIETAENTAEVRQLLGSRRAEISPEVIRGLKEHSDAMSRRDVALAVKIADAVLFGSRLLRDETGQALGLWAKANVERRAGRLRRSIRWYDHAATRFVRQGLVDDAARTLIGKIDALRLLGDYDGALACATEARRRFRRTGNDLELAKVEANAGNLFHRLDRYTDAIRHYDRARRLLAKLGEHELLQQVETNRANALTQLNRFRQARRVYDQVRAYYDAKGEDAAVSVAIVDTSIGFLEYAQGRYQQALTRLTSARDAFERAGLVRLAGAAELDLSDVYLALNLPEEASRAASQVKTSLDRLGLRYETARALVNKATAEAQLGRSRLAMSLLSEAQQLFRSEGNDAWVATVDLHRAILLLHSEDESETIEAWEICERAATVFRTLGLPTRLGYANLVLGRIAENLGDVDTATEHYQAATDIADRYHLPWLVHQAYHARARLGEQLADPRTTDYYRRSIAALESMWNDLQPEDLRTSFVSNRLQVYEDAVLHFLAQGDRGVRTAFHYVERAKSRALLDLLAGRLTLRARSGADRELTRRIEQLRSELNWYYNRLAAGERTPKQRHPAMVEEITEAISRREAELSKLIQELDLRQTEVASLQQVQACGLPEIQRLLPDDGALIEYYVAGEEVLAFVVLPDGERVYRALSDRASIQELSDRLRFQLNRFSYGPEFVAAYQRQLREATDAILEQLYAELIQPIRPSIVGRRLVIIPHGLLHYLPFHAFRSRRGYLVEEQEVSYSPSANVLRHCLDKPVRRPRRVLVAGIDDELLPEVEREVQGIAEVFPSATVLKGTAARQTTLARHLRYADVVHIASHGVYSAENPMFSRIKLADSWLSVHDIYGLRLRASLVTLSACETGVSQVAPGDELVGLARGFFYAGAASLLLSLWSVSDESTAQLMTAFYRRLVGGQPKAAALREAQLEVMDEYPHPYYWAPFVLHGRGDW